MPLEIVRNDILSDIRNNRKNTRQWKAKVDADYARRGGHNGK